MLRPYSNGKKLRHATAQECAVYHHVPRWYLHVCTSKVLGSSEICRLESRVVRRICTLVSAASVSMASLCGRLLVEKWCASDDGFCELWKFWDLELFPKEASAKTSASRRSRTSGNLRCCSLGLFINNLWIVDEWSEYRVMISFHRDWFQY